MRRSVTGHLRSLGTRALALSAKYASTVTPSAAEPETKPSLHSLRFLFKHSTSVQSVREINTLHQQAEKKRTKNCDVHHLQVFIVYYRACEKQWHRNDEPKCPYARAHF